MTLKSYRAKRRFQETAEPRGGKAKRMSAHQPAELRFVVQKHEASRLHYDFRLEMGGVLKSWAVPKGPSLNPYDKRLAVEVEDHPLEYRTFEGTIAPANYGAGTVMVWDDGTYEPARPSQESTPEKQLLADLEEGHLRIILHGAKLRGEFSLVRMKGGKAKNWLLIKLQDRFATPQDVSEQDRSVVTGRSLSEITAGKSAAKTPRSIKKSRHIKPMLATPVAAPFDGDDWIFEVKWDGYRAIAEIEEGEVALYSRSLHSFAEKFVPIVRSLEEIRHEAVLDGEVVVLDGKGRSQFQLLQRYQRTGRGTLVYYVFDLLFLDGKDLRSRPLRQRRARLEALSLGQGNIRISEYVERDGIAFFDAAKREGLEGIIAKDASSTYQVGARSRKWLKIKARIQQEAVIGGFTEPRGSRPGIGALVLGVYDHDRLQYIGHAGGGFDESELQAMRGRLESLEQKTCPFAKKPKPNAPVHWVKPTQVCEVAFLDWTEEGTMRQPIYLGMREDKSARSVQRELPTDPPIDDQHVPKRTSAAQGRKHAGSLPPGNFSNLDKVYWPKDGYTKGDVLRYYHEVSSFMLPYLQDRPFVLNRHPNGIHGPNFFQKDVSTQPPPDWVRTVSLPSKSAGKNICYLFCQDEPTLLYLANLGCIEMNVWNSRLNSLDKPDYLIIDLDPNDVPYPRVVATAQTVRQIVERGGGKCYCKTSGKRGLHVFIPLAARYDYKQASMFAEIIVRQVHALLPDETSVVRAPAQRRGKIYLDYLQNRRGQTMAAPYSIRPVEHALVSTPLRWSEVNKSLDPTRFDIKSMPRRLDKVGDLWKPVLGKGINSIPSAVA